MGAQIIVGVYRDDRPAELMGELTAVGFLGCNTKTSAFAVAEIRQ